MFLTEIVDLSNVYDFTSKKNEDFNIVIYYFKTNDGYNFSVEFGGYSSGNWDRIFLTKEKQFGELNTEEKFKILNTITKITLDFIEKYKPKKISIYHARTRKEIENDPNDENKRLRVNKYFLSKVLPKNYKINTFDNQSEISLVENKLKLKSRAKDIEKEKEEIINNIIKGRDFEELSISDIINIENLKKEFILNYVKNYIIEKYPELEIKTYNIGGVNFITNNRYRMVFFNDDNKPYFVLKILDMNYDFNKVIILNNTKDFINRIDEIVKEYLLNNLNESKQPINEIAELTNTYSYEKISADGDKVKYRFSDGEDIFFVKFQLLSIGKFNEEYKREYYTTNRWMDELNKGNILRIIGTVTKITLDFINDYRPGLIEISHIDSKKEISDRFSIDAILSGNKKKNSGENKRAKINRLFLSKNLPNDYSMEFISNITKIKRKDLNESSSNPLQ